MKNQFISLFSVLALVLLIASGCIGTDVIDDRVPASLRITGQPDTLAFGDSVQLQADFFDEVGRLAQTTVLWTSADPDIISITPSGLARAIKTGSTRVAVETEVSGEIIRDEVPLAVGQQTVIVEQTRKGTIRTTSSYELRGSFIVTQDGSDLLIDVSSDYQASTALPGLYLYLSNNPSSAAGALEVGRVAIFRGAHSYFVPNVTLGAHSHLLYFCKPFNVKVGDGAMEK